MTNHTDRELLELAARAVGLNHDGYTKNFFDPECHGSTGLVITGPIEWLWNPLENDADAFRLASDMDMTITIGDTCMANAGNGWFRVTNDDDKHAATRRAIVLAAAEIGANK